MIGGLYLWVQFDGSDSTLSRMFPIAEVAAVTAGLTLISAVAVYFWVPKPTSQAPTSVIPYLLLAATIALLILHTGGTTSPFVALWLLIAAFGGIFGLYGLLPLFITTVAYLGLQLTGGVLSETKLITTLLVGDLPLLASYFLWHRQSTPTHKVGDKAYRELASELSQVAGKAEVVINAIADGVIALNAQGNIELINPSAQQIIGWGKQDALGLNYTSVLKLVDKNGAELQPSTDPVAVALATNHEIKRTDLMLVSMSDKRIMLSIIVSPVGQLGEGIIVVFQDITNEKSEERAQAEFISTASHEMRTPVASIEGYLGLALNPATATIDAKARDFIQKAHESAEHLGRLFQDLLDVSRADDGRMSNHPKVIDMVDFVKGIVQGLAAKADEKGLHMIFKPQQFDSDGQTTRRLTPVYYVNSDPDHLREIVANLVENAIKYTVRGDVAIDVAGDDDNVIISIADSGIGIPNEDIPHLFQKFYRVDNSQTREIGGTGLGLYLCRRLIEAMNGRIWVESQFGQGSTFFVNVPRLGHEEAMRLIEAAADVPTIEPVRPRPAVSAPAAPTTTPPPTSASTSIPISAPVATPAIVQRPFRSMQPVLPSSVPRFGAQAAPAAPAPVTPLTPPATLSDIEKQPELYIKQRGPSLQVPVRGNEPPRQA